ncbi:ABC-2 transporter permease [candidate division KSB1 bacterium]
MFKLIKKDFIAGRLFIIIIPLIMMFVSMISISLIYDKTGKMIIGIFALIALMISTVTSFLFFLVDAAYNAEQIYASLPIKRSKIVYAGFCTTAILALTGVCIMICEGYLTVYFLFNSDPEYLKIFDLKILAAMVSFILIILSFFLPFVYSFGPGKGASVAGVFFIGLTLLKPVLSFSVNALNGIFKFDTEYLLSILKNIIDWLMGLKPVEAYLTLAGVLALFLLTSITISVWFFKKRDI